MHIPYPLRGESPSILRIRDLLLNAARTDFPVLLTGESGTGKQAAAEWIHTLSPRKRRAFVEANVSCWNGNSMLHSMLFGHERGAFTGALRRHQGYFEQAQGGSLFLDEIGELDPSVQPLLLKVLARGRLERVGAQSLQQVDVRLISATNRDLVREVREGRFRHDLLARLRCLEICLPPLRDRIEDLPLLWDGICELRGLSLPVPADLGDTIRESGFHDNLRGLERLAIQRAVWGESSNLPC